MHSLHLCLAVKLYEKQLDLPYLLITFHYTGDFDLECSVDESGPLTIECSSVYGVIARVFCSYDKGLRTLGEMC